MYRCWFSKWTFEIAFERLFERFWKKFEIFFERLRSENSKYFSKGSLGKIEDGKFEREFWKDKNDPTAITLNPHQ